MTLTYATDGDRHEAGRRRLVALDKFLAAPRRHASRSTTPTRPSMLSANRGPPHLQAPRLAISQAGESSLGKRGRRRVKLSRPWRTTPASCSVLAPRQVAPFRDARWTQGDTAICAPSRRVLCQVGAAPGWSGIFTQPRGDTELPRRDRYSRRCSGVLPARATEEVRRQCRAGASEHSLVSTRREVSVHQLGSVFLTIPCALSLICGTPTSRP